MTRTVPAMPPRPQRGAALLTTLLLVAVMATTATLSLERLTRSTRLAAAAQAQDEARLASISLENAAIAAIAARLPRPGATADDALTLPYTASLPTGTGEGTLTVSDAQNCFNVNSLIRIDGNADNSSIDGNGGGVARAVPDGYAAQQLDRLVQLVGGNSAPGLAASAAAQLMARVAPDGAVASLRFAGVAHPAALPAISALPAATARRLAPWLCALPTHALSPINVNSLSPDQAALVAMLAPGGIDLASARETLAARPAAGWRSIDQFWAEPALRRAQPPLAVRAQITLASRRFLLSTRLTPAGTVAGTQDAAIVTSRVIIDMTQLLRPRRIARQWGGA